MPEKNRADWPDGGRISKRAAQQPASVHAEEPGENASSPEELLRLAQEKIAKLERLNQALARSNQRGEQLL
jgi:hypothetical protein